MFYIKVKNQIAVVATAKKNMPVVDKAARMQNEETTYECLPEEIRAMIWKYRTRMRKDAAIIIFRNFIRYTITCDLDIFLEDQLEIMDVDRYENDLDFDPDYLPVFADQYNERPNPFAGKK